MKSSLLVSLPASKSKRPMTAGKFDWIQSKVPTVVFSALQRLEKVTRFWPLVLGETVMFNLTYVKKKII